MATLSCAVTRVGPTNSFNTYIVDITGDVDTRWALSIAATNSSGSPSSVSGFPTLDQSATPPNVSFNPNTISPTFSNTLIANQNGAGVNQFSNRLNQVLPLPLPLSQPQHQPLLGAGTALAFSRKRRIRMNPAD